MGSTTGNTPSRCLLFELFLKLHALIMDREDRIVSVILCAASYTFLPAFKINKLPQSHFHSSTLLVPFRL
jgi:hypothetical protein